MNPKLHRFFAATIAVVLLFAFVPPAQAAYVTYNCDALTGGASRALDSYPVASLAEGYRAICAVSGEFLYFRFSATATDAENVADHPYKVRPDDYTTQGVWIEQQIPLLDEDDFTSNSDQLPPSQHSAKAYIDGKLIDEDDFASNLDTKAPTQQSTKAYIATKGFVDRGDATANDFDETSLTEDGNWHDMDLSAIVPAGAKAVCLRVRIQDDAVGSYIQFRRNGNSDSFNVFLIATQAAGANYYDQGIVPLDSNRVIEFFASNTTWTAIKIVVIGWFL